MVIGLCEEKGEELRAAFTFHDGLTMALIIAYGNDALEQVRENLLYLRDCYEEAASEDLYERVSTRLCVIKQLRGS